MGSPTNCGDTPVKKDLFKDVKYYVAGSIAPEVSVGYSIDFEFIEIFSINFPQFCYLFIILCLLS